MGGDDERSSPGVDGGVGRPGVLGRGVWIDGVDEPSDDGVDGGLGGLNGVGANVTSGFGVSGDAGRGVVGDPSNVGDTVDACSSSRCTLAVSTDDGRRGIGARSGGALLDRCGPPRAARPCGVCICWLWPDVAPPAGVPLDDLSTGVVGRGPMMPGISGMVCSLAALPRLA